MSPAAPQIHIFPTPEALADGAARYIERAARESVDDHGRFALALSGGQTPLALYERLRAAGPKALPYDQVEIFWSDERLVPPDDPERNAYVAWQAWLAGAPVAAERIHRVPEGRDPDTVAAAYEREVKRVLGEAPHFDLILLGVGEDGHTASLFPHSPALASPRLVAAAVSPLPPLRRVTFTPALITAAARALVLATGGEKAEAVRRALEEPPSPAVPASLLRGGNVLWHLDQAAARLLQRPHQPTSAG